jgi:hypothetical protein
MELIRQRSVSSNLVFPLVLSGSNSYCTSGWNTLTNTSISAYSFSDSTSASSIALTNTPTLLASTGLFNLTITSSDTNSDYLAIKLKSDQTLEQTILVILTSYQFKSLADTSNKVTSNNVTVISNLDKTNYSISGTKKILDNLNDINGSSVTATSVTDKTNYSISGTKKLLDNLNDINGSSVTATSVTDKSNYTISAGTVNNVTNQVSVSANTDKTGYSVISVPQVQVSGINSGIYIGTSAFSNFPQVYVSAGQVTNVTGNVSGSVNNIVIPPTISVGQVAVSAYSNFPQVQVSGINDGIQISAGSIGQVQVSGINSGVISSATFTSDYYTQILTTELSAIDSAFSYSGNDVPVTVSAYMNFPAVTVSAVNNGVIASASYTTDYYNKVQSLSPNVNITAVRVSAMDQGPISQIQSGLASATDITIIKNTINAISAVTIQFIFSGGNVNANMVGAQLSGISATVDPTAVVDALLTSVIDTKTFEDIMTILLANSVGVVNRTGGVFTYNKQNGTTVAFQNTVTSSGRTRTG